MLQALLPVLGAAAGGAMSGASSFLGGKNQGQEYEYDYHPLDKQFKLASQALIPLYLKLITGGVPSFLKNYLNQAQSSALQQAQLAGQNYLREIGTRGMDFGPQQAAAIQKIYEGVTPAVIGAMNQARMSMVPQAMQGMQQWSGMRPMQTGTTQTQPSLGSQMGAGALGYLSGALNKPMPAKVPPTPATSMPPYMSASSPTAARGELSSLIGKSTGLSNYLNPDMLKGILKMR